MDRKPEEFNVGEWADERLAELGPDAAWQPDVQRGLVRLREQRQRAVRRVRRWMWMTAAATAACVTLMATPVTRAFAQRCVSACVSETGWVRQLLMVRAVASSAYVSPELRKMAPDFTLNDAAGMAVKLSGFRGKVVLLNFWATWCPPCRAEIPWFIEFQKTAGDRGFQVLGISLDEDGWKKVKPFITEQSVNYPIMLANSEVTRLYNGVPSVPTTLIIDKAGRIAAIHVGQCSRGDYAGDIRTVLNE